MGLKPTRLGTNGAARRKLASWIESFVDYTSNLEAPEIFRKWTAIGTIAAALEQRVWLTTSAPLYPNLYTILIGHPGVGKTRTIMIGRAFLSELPEFHIAPTSMLMASLVDALAESKRSIVNVPNPIIEYNSLALLMDEWGAFMHKYDDELIGGLTTFYDVVVPYEQRRRGRDLRIKIKRPQLNIIAGSTPSNLIKFMPEIAWDQGFTSRIILVFSDQRNEVDDFSVPYRTLPPSMIHDIKMINSLLGEFAVTEEYKESVRKWRADGQKPLPTHPKLIHYCTRRRAHLYKLSMVASVDRGDSLLLTAEDFNRALAWLVEAELYMPEIFKAGSVGADAKIMDELYHFVMIADAKKKGVSEHKVVDFARERAPAHSVIRIIEVMVQSGMLEKSQPDRLTGLHYYRAIVKEP